MCVPVQRRIRSDNYYRFTIKKMNSAQVICQLFKWMAIKGSKVNTKKHYLSRQFWNWNKLISMGKGWCVKHTNLEGYSPNGEAAQKGGSVYKYTCYF
jgi:hypothetical protein